MLLGLTSVFLDTKLNWYTGCWAMAPVGNLLDSTVEEIVDTNRFRKRIKNMVDLKCPGCTCGFDENIDVNSLPRTFFEKILTKFNL